MNKVINAFHKDYVATYMPEFMSNIRKESAQKLNGEKYGSMNRATRESVGGSAVFTISHTPKTKRVSLAPTDFYMYSRAGMPKGVK
jgi:hypothetical protein